MTGKLWWDHEDAAHIRSRSARYPGATDVDPEDSSGVTAWKTRGADLRDYLENKEAGP